MCEFCIKHGEGKKWYKNMTNYTREVFLQVNSEEELRQFLLGFGESMKRGERHAVKWKKRVPMIYNLLIYPWLTKHQKKNHFGQILPIEEVEDILGQVGSIVRLPCICRKINTGIEQRTCYAVGLDMTHILKDQPDFCNFDRISKAEAVEEMRRFDRDGLTHSVWTFKTPYLGAICNCDRDCMAYRIQNLFKLAKVMWKGEFVATIDQDRCRGCRECKKTCYFDAIRYDRRHQKCQIEVLNCYGCGICRTACKEDAISLCDRRAVPLAADSW